MERSDVVGLILNSEKMIEVFIKEIDEDVNKSNYLSFKGTPSLKIWDIAKDIDKIAKYILDGKEDFERFKTELFNIRTRTKELQSKTFQKYEPFAHHCDMIINIIDNMERFAPNQPSIVPGTEATNNNGLSTGENDKSGDMFEGVEMRYIRKYVIAFQSNENYYKAFFEECKGKDPYAIAAMLYNNDNFINCQAIKAVYHVCVVPNMTDKTYVTYETFLNTYNTYDEPK